MKKTLQGDLSAAGGVNPWLPAEDWTLLKGLEIEIYDDGKLIDCGSVEIVSADGRLLWLRQDGAMERRIIEKLPDLCVRPLPVCGDLGGSPAQLVGLPGRQVSIPQHGAFFPN